MPTEDDAYGEALRGRSEKLMWRGYKMPLEVGWEHVRPLGDRVVVLVKDLQAEMAGLISLPERAKPELHRGEIVRNCLGPNSHAAPLALGTMVLYHPLAGLELDTPTGRIRILRHRDILAVEEKA